MEDKLLELKEQFCKFYCPNKSTGIEDYDGYLLDKQFVCKILSNHRLHYFHQR